MITIRKASERGHFDHGWLDTYHTFSFGDYFDPDHVQFQSLRVINEDFVEADRGFPTHAHSNMEIITYVLSGELQHKDSMGNGSMIYPGDVQRMTAGTGVTHSEANTSSTQKLHLLQIWILPEKKGLTPSYEQKTFSVNEKKNKLKLVASRDGREGSVTVHQDVNMYATVLDAGQEVTLPLSKERHAWIHVVTGDVTLNNQHTLQKSDGAAISSEDHVTLKSRTPSEIILFEMK